MRLHYFALLLAMAASAFPPEISGMTAPPGWTERAIAFGSIGHPTPYVLRSNFPDRSVVGAVYTPFLRVALAARQAAEQGRRLDVEQLPPSAVEPVIWVRFYYAKHPAAGPDFANMEPSFGIVPAQRISPIGGVSPVWVKPIDAAVLFDAAHTVARKAWVAAFRPADVKPDQDFVMFWSTQSPGGGGTAVQIRGGIRAEDLQAWR